MTHDTENQTNPKKPTVSPEIMEKPLTSLQKILIETGRRQPPPAPVPALTHGVDNAYVMNLPNNLTAASISKLTQSLDPAHPAADLSAMNAQFLSLMISEYDQGSMLRRQAQTLDTLFHAMIGHGLVPKTKQHEETTLDKDIIAFALQSQSQCYDVLKSLKTMEYTEALTQHIISKETRR